MNLFLPVAGSYLMVAMLGFALGQLNAQLQHRRDHEIDAWWPALPEIDSWSEPAPAYDWEEEGIGL